jgi:AraC-like DNA-binding protein
MLDLDGRRMIVLVISSAGATDLQEGFVRIIDQINRQGKLSATAGLGCAYPSLAEVRKSYLEASAALDYRLVGGEQRLFYFPDLFEKHVNFGCLYDKLGDRLEIAVLQGQDDQAVHLIHELIDEMTTQRMPLFAARLFLHDVINSMTHRAAQRFGSSTLAYDLDIYRIEKINNIRELAEAVCNAIKKLCQSVKEYHEHGYEERRLYQEYLHKNGLSDMFSVAGMARDFKCSQPSLNQHFKQCMNTTIWDAVVSMRIERAKQLLSETSMTLQEIVNLIGYKDTSNFVRKFRNVTGKTPGEYRLLYTMPNQPGLE